MIKNIITTSCLSLVALSSAQAIVVAFDESADGDLGAPTAPTLLTFGIGTNTVTGQVDTNNGDTRDAIAFTLSAGQTLDSIILLAYDNPDTLALSDGNTGFFSLDNGLVSVIPGGGTSGEFLTGSTFNSTSVGSDLLDLGNLTDGPGITGGQLGPGDYTFNIQNTSTISSYELQFNVVPEPSSTALLGLGGLALAIRRRR